MGFSNSFVVFLTLDSVYVHYSPDGRRVKTKAQLARILGNKFDLAGFDFRTGRILSGGVHRRKFESFLPYFCCQQFCG